MKLGKGEASVKVTYDVCRQISALPLSQKGLERNGHVWFTDVVP